MAFRRDHHLSREQILELFADYSPSDELQVVRIRYKNWKEIRRPETTTVGELVAFILESMEDDHQPGGDLLAELPGRAEVLFGHHDGVYWLEERGAMRGRGNRPRAGRVHGKPTQLH